MNSKDYSNKQIIKDLVQQARFYEENDNCPTCDQVIDEDMKQTKLSTIGNDANTLQQDMAILQKEIEVLKLEIQELKEASKNPLS